MNNSHLMYSRVLVVIVFLLTTGSTHAAPPPKPTAAECDAGLSWTETSMDFGTYVGSTAGTIVMDVAGAMTPAGVVLVGAGGGAPLTFNFTNSVAGCGKKNITITLPADITIFNGGSSVVINGLNTSIAPQTKFKLNTVTQITIGGTLNAGAADAFGTYNGDNLFDFSY